MAEIITISNQKGGSSKTATAAALYSGLILKGRKCLAVDLDAQCNLSLILGVEANVSITDVLRGNISINDAIQHLKRGDAIAASIGLNDSDFIIANGRLREVLKEVKSKYDFIIIDTPPAFGTLTINALTASTSVIVPALADLFSLQGVQSLFVTIAAIQNGQNPDLKNRGILITQHNERVLINRSMAEELDKIAREYATKVFKSHIRYSTIIRKAAVMAGDIISFMPESNVASDYQAFIDELLDDLEQEWRPK